MVMVAMLLASVPTEHWGAGVPLPDTEHERAIALLYPFRGVTVTVELEVPPGVTEAGFGALAEMVKSGAVACV